ncbi:MAG: exodeoxyribonuclease VII large subunit [Oscillospiraceae bacterium]|nr:exodeoxyribonuclease VII large subunit [Oscillospiraceae bacterium]
MNGTVYEVAQVNRYIKEMLDSDPELVGIFVRGELSNYKVYPSGHHYFTLKDSESTLKCVMFRSNAGRLKFRPENGMRVVAGGNIAVYPRDGVYQLYCERMITDGEGDLHIAFEQLKEKLFKEGLFAPEHKKPIPRYPERIAVITSPAGAAVRDILRILGARFPVAKITIVPVRVQGAEAPGEIAEAIRTVNELHLAELIITGRGGGSIEDLWAFNDERVARAIYASVIPVISAVGHEPDVTIADFVADLRAATPSNAAELAVPDGAELNDALRVARERMRSALRAALDRNRAALERLVGSRVLVSPESIVTDRRLLLDSSCDRLAKTAKNLTGEARARFASAAASLDAMSPLKVLARGYSVATGPDGSVIRSIRDVKQGDQIKIRTADGRIGCTVEDRESI